ncbi:hypothetical protein NMY22_g908 [Coprinellus aureogranulatus]|nr:hypothetical protein NMY22_g908 [Coprinellus aureogranulatus]
MALLRRGRLAVTLLSIIWALVTVWGEYLQFTFDGSKCKWPDHNFRPLPLEDNGPRPQHILIVADPQILDHRSYPGRGALLTWLSRIIVDLNLRKNWWAAISKKPDAVVFLGDMMDGGRFDMSDEEYEEYFQRFKSIFKLDPAIPQYFIPGNHDTGLGFSQHFSPYTHLRYTTHFGEKNYAVHIANHTLAFIDAPGFVDEESKRLGKGKNYESWKPLPDGALEFMTRFKHTNPQDPVVLFTHVPLYRPDGRGCGPLRERGTIRPGVGDGYQNTLGKQSTLKLLDLLSPSLVFSGDDHDYCEHIHHVSTPSSGPAQVREVTVKALSMAMGIKRPGFQLLSLAPTELRREHGGVSYADAPCFLPNQLATYLRLYIPLGVVSLLIVAASQFLSLRGLRPRTNMKNSVDYGGSAPDYYDDDDLINSHSKRPSFRLTPANRRARRDASESDSSTGLPVPVSSADNHPSGLRGSSILGYGNALLRQVPKVFSVSGPSSRPRMSRRPRTRLASFLYDVRDIAVWPIGLFILITWWFA